MENRQAVYAAITRLDEATRAADASAQSCLELVGRYAAGTEASRNLGSFRSAINHWTRQVQALKLASHLSELASSMYEKTQQPRSALAKPIPLIQEVVGETGTAVSKLLRSLDTAILHFDYVDLTTYMKAAVSQLIAEREELISALSVIRIAGQSIGPDQARARVDDLLQNVLAAQNAGIALSDLVGTERRAERAQQAIAAGSNAASLDASVPGKASVPLATA
jgi:hypothetical protein